MTRPHDQSGEDAAGILRAIGSLLVALSGNVDNPDLDRTVDQVLGREEPPYEAPRHEGPGRAASRPGREPGARQRPAAASRSRLNDEEYIPSPELIREVDFVLSDARERARQILDESMERAEGLLRPDLRSVPGIDPRAFEDLRQATRGLATEIRDVQRRLSRIEALLRASSAARVRMDAGLPMGDPDEERLATHEFDLVEDEPPPPSDPNAPAAARTSAPETGAPQTPPRPFIVPEPRATAPVPPPPTPPPPAMDPSPSTIVPDDDDRLDVTPDDPIPPRGRDGTPLEAAPPDLPPSAIPQMRPSSPPPPPPPVPATPATEPDEAWDSELEPIFHPDDGPIVLRVSPVSGFQGLMRVHDAIVRVEAVSQATVEAYSQGEARMRVDLAEDIVPSEFVSALGRTLQEPTSVRGTSIEKRELLVTLQ